MSSSFEYGSDLPRVGASPELEKRLDQVVTEIGSGPKPASQEPAAAKKSKPREPTSTREDFKGTSVPIQLKLDSELIESLKLIAVSSKRSMSEIVMSCLTSSEKISKTWTTTRRDAA